SLCRVPRPPRSSLFPYTTLFRSTRSPWIWVNELVTICTSMIARNNPVPIAEDAGLAEHAPHCHLAERGELLAQEFGKAVAGNHRSEEHTSELQSRRELVCRLLLE